MIKEAIKKWLGIGDSCLNIEMFLAEIDRFNFEIDEDFIHGTEMVFVNGVLQKYGRDNDFVILGRRLAFNERANIKETDTIRMYASIDTNP